MRARHVFAVPEAVPHTDFRPRLRLGERQLQCGSTSFNEFCVFLEGVVSLAWGRRGQLSLDF